MNLKELKSRIDQGEGYNLEFKESFSDTIAKDICAFANALGGKILLGITDDKEIKGINLSNTLRSRIIDIARNFNPRFEVELEEINNNLIINVPDGRNKPYSVGGKFYLRIGPNSQQLERDEIRDLFINEGLVHFDEKINPVFDLEKDFNKEAYKKFLHLSKISGLIDEKDLLEKLVFITVWQLAD